MPNSTAVTNDEDAIFMTVRDHHIAGLIIFIVGLCGATANYLVVFLIDKVSSLRNAFGRLTMNQSLGESIHLTVFALYFAPTVFFDIKWLKSEAVSRVFGHINLICYDICIYSHFVISINRFTAIYLPFKYNIIFTDFNVRCMVAVIWALATLPSFYLYIIEDCRFIYSDAFWNFDFTHSKVCQFITWYTDFLKYVSIIFIIATIDLITFAKVRFVSSKVHVHCAIARRKRNDEINFVKQVCLEGLVFVCELITYFVLVNYFEDKWTRFFLTTFAWEMVHSCDGFITLFFNKGFLRIISAKLRNSIVGHSSHNYHQNSHSDQIHTATTTQKTIVKH